MDDESLDCPKCGLSSPGSALLCDCGYDFAEGQATRHLEWDRRARDLRIWAYVGAGLAIGGTVLFFGSLAAASLGFGGRFYSPLGATLAGIALFRWSWWRYRAATRNAARARGGAP